MTSTNGTTEPLRRVLNLSNAALKIWNQGAQEFRIVLAGSDSPVDFDAEFVATLEPNRLIDGAPIWALGVGAVAHVTEYDENLFISCVERRVVPHDTAPVKGAPSKPRSGERWVTILGAGISGLSAAHELVERGFRVQVIEKSHGSPVAARPAPRPRMTVAQNDGGRSNSGTESLDLAERYSRGLDEPDVGGIARTQWSTAPWAKGDPIPLETDLWTTDRGAGALPRRSLRSVHGDGDWSDPSVRPLEVRYGADGTLDPTRLEADLETWLARIEKRSIGALQLVVVVYGGGAASGTAAAYRRLEAFLALLEQLPDPPRSKLANVTAFPVARLDLDTPFVENGTFVGLYARHHEHLGLIAGEHGFRFFPGFYRHLRDVMQRTPIFDEEIGAFTERTVDDHLCEVLWQVVVDPRRTHPGAIPRTPFRSLGELAEQYRTIRRDLGYRPKDLLRFFLRMARYATSSTRRREQYYERISWSDFLEVRSHEELPSLPGETPSRWDYGERFQKALEHAPRALVAMSSTFADARTQGNVSLQLAMDGMSFHKHTDSTLMGPTSQSWFRHWRDYLVSQGVQLFVGEVISIDTSITRARAGAEIAFPSGSHPDRYVDVEAAIDTWNKETDGPLPSHYYLCALDAVAAAKVTAARMPAAVDLGVVSDLQDWVPATVRGQHLSAFGTKPSDRFQTLTGIQLYYDARVAFSDGHIYFADSDWGLSALSQIQYWGPFGSAGRGTQLLGNLSIDIGSFRDRGAPTMKREAIAAEVAKQISHPPATAVPSPSRTSPPAFYHLDDYIQFDPQSHEAKWNRSPFLINLVDEWRRRPRGEPWTPNSLAGRNRVPGRGGYADPAKRLWRHNDGGYVVHFDNLVFAGTYLKTFTRLGTMESANESARHAVNAILDHLSRDQPADRGVNALLAPRYLVATRFGDYCDIWDPEENELRDLDFLKKIDESLVRAVDSPGRGWPKDEPDDRPPSSTPGPQADRMPAHLFDHLSLDELPDLLGDEDDEGALQVFDLLKALVDAIGDAAGPDRDLPLKVIHKLARLAKEVRSRLEARCAGG